MGERAAGRRVAIVGAGISGIAQAHVFRKNGFDVAVFEKSPEVGGVWALAYPDVRLQNQDFQYHLSDVPWPFAADDHPTGEQIRRYWSGAAAALGIDVRLGHEVVAAARREGGGWAVTARHDGATATHECDYLVVAVGQYADGKRRPAFEGEGDFRGEVGTERDVRSLESFRGARVVVVGFGKSALDMATLAAGRGAAVHHVFRTPRWTLPRHILGVHSSWFLFNRFGSVMMTSWAHPTAAERFVHRRLRPAVGAFWGALGDLIRWQTRRAARGAGPEGAARIEALLPPHGLLRDLRSAAALTPDDYLAHVAAGRIEPRCAGLAGFDADGVRLTDGTRLACDRVVLSLGSESPRFPFLPAADRALLEAEPDGPQLYRHLIHPRIAGVGFAGFNHGFLHVPAAEVGAQWLCCLLRGELTLPSPEAMERSIDRVRAWKREHIAFEPSRSCAINTRYQQYLDILLQDLGVSPYRKLPNPIAEVFGRYGSADYAGVVDEVRRGGSRLRAVLPLDT
ncbi:MAG: NAD(P)/FAD-dependent oxidoreductase [Myxococcaceae bacterium]|nr:NAD(P)/FAD-dependent oxidoreductase [Myxococcaceae bacterium]